ncbi:MULTISPECIES: 5'-3' exonuclease [Sporosarcina]|uniref:5'-3' exonuclease n=2 Tax=Sporosarcina newyorkensis TaxID=759851 RepID=A0A1T4YIQ4_9BACL|nr:MULTISPECIES: 5'-3' exonuclease [Sporosarcina]EGQ20845.1 DNA-directed DNA polymerase I [Sporosarcina newyorkensis 2681]MBY0221854.1 5'-3' exonuclease [Sporosarcina aquimarina]SKB01580.1 5'-3' exonuclease [Sporosarcina newyorkensis]
MNETKPHILLIDGMALLFRSFFATAHSGQFFRNANDIPTNGVQGFARHTMSAISIFQPTHMAVCWDMGAKTFRNELFADYKAHRPAPAPELVPQFDMAREVSETLGWKNYGIPNMEADDLIGSMIKTWKNEAKLTIVSGDKDLLQLLGPDVSIAFTKKGYTQYDEYNEARFIEEYGITPAQFIDMKAFTGDSSDGYPGVKGIGPKTALKLIQQYGSVDGVLAAREELTAGVRKKIDADGEMLMLSRELATIHCELTLDDPLEQLIIPEFTEDRARLMNQQGYSLIARQGLSVSPF